MLAFLARGDVDGIIHFEPNIGSLLSTGKYKVFADFNGEWKNVAGQRARPRKRRSRRWPRGQDTLAASGLRSGVAVRRLVMVTLAGLHPSRWLAVPRDGGKRSLPRWCA